MFRARLGWAHFEERAATLCRLHHVRRRCLGVGGRHDGRMKRWRDYREIKVDTVVEQKILMAVRRGGGRVQEADAQSRRQSEGNLRSQVFAWLLSFCRRPKKGAYVSKKRPNGSIVSCIACQLVDI